LVRADDPSVPRPLLGYPRQPLGAVGRVRGSGLAAPPAERADHSRAALPDRRALLLPRGPVHHGAAPDRAVPGAPATTHPRPDAGDVRGRGADAGPPRHHGAQRLPGLTRKPLRAHSQGLDRRQRGAGGPPGLLNEGAPEDNTTWARPRRAAGDRASTR